MLIELHEKYLDVQNMAIVMDFNEEVYKIIIKDVENLYQLLTFYLKYEPKLYLIFQIIYFIILTHTIFISFN
jgi:hypothetical protein